MPRKIFRNIAILVLSSLLAGCSYILVLFDSVTETITSRDPYTEVEAKQIFDTHYGSLERLVTTCENNPELYRVRVDEPSKKLNDMIDSDLLIKIRKEMSNANITGMICSREHNLPDRPLGGVTFHLFSSGLSVSGISQSFYYLTKQYRERNPIRKLNDIPLNKKGWYVSIK